MNNSDLTELINRVNADDPDALFKYAELVRETNPTEAYKYTVLAAQLGNPYAMERVGDMYFDRGDYKEAEHYYKTGANAGILDCSVKLAVINMPNDEQRSLQTLEELAEAGIKSACSALADYYLSHGNKKEYAYWRSLIK